MSKSMKKNILTIKVDGKTISSTTKNGLVKEFMKKTNNKNKNDSINVVNRLLRNKKDIFVIGNTEEDGMYVSKIEKIDISNSFKGILREEFDLNRISTSKVVTPSLLNKTKDVVSAEKISKDMQISTIDIKLFVTYYDAIDNILKDDYKIDNDEYDAIYKKYLNKKKQIDKNREYNNIKKEKEKIELEKKRLLEINKNPISVKHIDEKKITDSSVEIRHYYAQIPINKREIIKNDSDKIREFVARTVAKLIETNYYQGGKILMYKYNTLTYVKTRNIRNKEEKKNFIADAEQAKKIKASKYYLGDEEYKLTEWANIVSVGKWRKGEDSCAVKFISKHYSELYSKIKRLETEKGISINDFASFCNKYGIYYIFNNVCGEEVDTNREFFDNLTEDDEIKALRAIIYRGHIYPYSGRNLEKNKIPKKKMEIVNVDNIKERLINEINNNIIPSNIKVLPVSGITGKKALSVISFVSDKKKYFTNSDYNRCEKILNELGYTKNIPIDISTYNIVDYLIKYDDSKKPIYSFFPQKRLFKSKALVYQKKNIDKLITEKKIDTSIISGIDKNKCYPYALCELKYLIIHDWRKNNVTNIRSKKDHKIIDHYLYLVDPEYFSIILPYRQLYPGYHVKKAISYNVKFNLIEEYETTVEKNFLRQIIKSLYSKLTNDEFKKAMVVLIGKFERNIKETSEYTFNGIYDEKDSNLFGGVYKKIDDMYIHFNETNKIKYVRDNMAVNIQIKSKAYELLADKICEMKIDSNDIIQINTDSIFFKDPSKKYNINNYTEDEIKKMKSNFNGWKILSEFKSMPSSEIIQKGYVPESLKLKNDNNNTRILHMKYAGNGKTHYIVNDLVPKLKKEGKSYIVLTPTHSTLEEYKYISECLEKKEKFYKSQNLPYDPCKVGKINCAIIQEFSLRNMVPKEDYIIIDEIGFCGAEIHDLLYKLNYLNKSFECFGDFNQLMPVGEKIPYNQKHYINYMFDSVRTEFSNYRNNFSKDFYNSIIKNKVNSLDIIKKYSTCYDDIDFNDTSQVCICYRKETREKINEKILKYLKLQHDSIGVRLICTDNTLGDFGIWNNKQLIITHTTPEDITLIDSNRKEYTLSRKKVAVHFIPAYCINIYSAQGKSLNAYCWIDDDDWFIYNDYDHNATNMAYTIVSRLIHKKTDIQTTLIRCNQKFEEIRNDVHNIKWEKIFNK